MHVAGFILGGASEFERFRGFEISRGSGIGKRLWRTRQIGFVDRAAGGQFAQFASVPIAHIAEVPFHFGTLLGNEFPFLAKLRRLSRDLFVRRPRLFRERFQLGLFLFDARLRLAHSLAEFADLRLPFDELLTEPRHCHALFRTGAFEFLFAQPDSLGFLAKVPPRRIEFFAGLFGVNLQFR